MCNFCYANKLFQEKRKSKLYAENLIFYISSFYRVSINIFLDIYKMSKKVLNLLIMMVFPTIQTLIDFTI